jgi:hypothetical protein
MKPRVFIGSSSEGLSVAYAIQGGLDEVATVTVWTQDIFRPTEYILETLLKHLNQSDVGIFVFTPDDLTRIRGVEQSSVRDNVIFEFGLFVGHLGRDKSIVVMPKGDNARLPSDLLGVNVLKYKGDRDDGNLSAALGPANASIRQYLVGIQPKDTQTPGELAMPFAERRDLLSNRQRDILKTIENRGQCSPSELERLFADIGAAELTYRLEQLRLLMFISMLGHGDDAVYTLSESYKPIKGRRISTLTQAGRRIPR